ncbi:MAG: hypothetical protein WC868_08030 [Bacteroidales bacterium]
MRKYFILISGITLVSLMACGPSQEEQERQKKIDDSLFEKNRNTVLDNANKLLLDTAASGKDSSANTKTK